MKNILYSLLGLLFLALGACSDEVMDEINENPNNPTDVKSNLIITDVIVSTTFRVVSGDFNYYASVYAEHNVGIYNQFYNADTRTTEPLVAATYNNTWEAIYTNLYNANIIIDKCSEGGSEEGNYHTLAIAQIISAINLATLTDGVGDAPWSEALQPGEVYTPKIDSQESIYAAVLKFLTDAVVNLGKETEFPALGSQDPIYSGDAAMWLKAANGLLARYTMRLQHVTPDLGAVIAYANESFVSSDDECKLDWTTIGAKSPFQAFFDDRDYYGASQSMHDKLVAKNDPRDDFFWKAHPSSGASDILFAKSGDPDQVGQIQGLFSISALTNSDAPTFVMSYHELEFLKAEVYVRNGMLAEAQVALENGITAAFLKISYAFNLKGDYSTDSISGMASTYFNTQVLPRFNADALSEVMIQKYFACFEEEAFQIYCDIRRLMAMGEGDLIPLSHPQPDKYPLRYTYGSSDVTTNTNVDAAYQDVKIFEDNVWWAGGNK